MTIPFDTGRLDRLMEADGLDVILATSAHNVQYLLGGYQFQFFSHKQALGTSRYLPIFIYRKGHPESAAYIGNRLEIFEKELGLFWPGQSRPEAWGTTDAIALAVDHLKGLYDARSFRLGIEYPFMPLDAAGILRDGLPNAHLAEAYHALERLRSVKTPRELERLRTGSEKVVAAMASVIGNAGPGMTKADIVSMLKREETNRDLTFEYCLITAGTSHNRAPSDQVLEAGDVVSLDSGANHLGWVADLCRMGVLGEPDQELIDLLGLVDEVQQQARRPIRAGEMGGAIFESASRSIASSQVEGEIEFLAHGMGLVSHEAPRLTSHGPVPYSGFDEHRPLEAGMVISIETTLKHPRRGYIKLEDTVAVLAEGCEGFGDTPRDWIRSDTA